MTGSQNSKRGPLWFSGPRRFLALAIFCLGTTTGHGANVLANPGFEADPAGQTQTILDWTLYGPSGVSAFGESNPLIAHGGSDYFKVFQGFTGSANYSGIYQDVLSGPGAIYAADAWAYTASTDTIAGANIAWVEVTFRDAGGNILALYRSAQITTNNVAAGSFRQNSWHDLAVTNQCDPNTGAATNQTASLTAPANTSYARFQIVFQGDANYSAGSMYFDDLNLTQISGAPYGNWNIVWSDEFNEALINHNVWTYDIGNNNGWGNNELEYYTAAPQNSYLSGGLLHIAALRQSTNGYSYTSARIKSQGLYAAEYGRFEWRARLPAGVGFWPALWMLGDNINSVGWPGCGEIDVVENNSSALTNVQGSLHSGSDETAVYTLPEGSVTNFHTYTLDWMTNAISWYVDGIRYETQTNWSSSVGSYPVPFNQPFFIIMNLAVGGNYTGNPTTSQINSSAFPAELQVDYVRLYNVTAPLQIAASPVNGRVKLQWPTNIICHLQVSTNLSGWNNVTGASSPYEVAPASAAFYRIDSP